MIQYILDIIGNDGLTKTWVGLCLYDRIYDDGHVENFLTHCLNNGEVEKFQEMVRKIAEKIAEQEEYGKNYYCRIEPNSDPDLVCDYLAEITSTGNYVDILKVEYNLSRI